MKTKQITRTAILGAAAYLLQFLGDIIPKVGGFLELEPSDFPAIIAALAMGPLYGVLVVGIKNILHFLTISSTGGIGDIANFLINSSFVIVCGYIYKFHKGRKAALISLLTATLAMSIAGIFVNYFLLVPFYIKDIDPLTNLNLVLLTITPFNLVKGTLLSILTFFSYKKISRLLK